MRKVFIAGVDGYLGWALAQYLAAKGFTVTGLDDCRRREIWVPSCGSDSAIPIANLTERIRAFRDQYGDHHFTCVKTEPFILPGYGNVARYNILCKVFEDFQPDTIVNLAQMASAPYSMKDFEHANSTYINNIGTTMSVLWAVKDVCPHVPIITIGTAGEYGTPGIKITEGDIKIELHGRSAELPFPKTPASLYHASKVASTVIYERACTWWNLAATDVMQGVVYGVKHEHMTNRPEMATRMDFDQCFPPGVQVAVPYGQKSIENISIGDAVLTHKGRFHPVTKIFENDYEGDLICLNVHGFENELKCTPTHPLLVIPDGKMITPPEWKAAEDILLEKEAMCTCHLVDDDFIQSKVQKASRVSYKGKVYNLHVSKDNSYVANTFCVHNCFGTALNRFAVQAIIGHPLTVYGAGTQQRGFLPLRDSMRCLQLLIEHPPEPGKVRIVNQYDQVYSINELAQAVEKIAKEHGISVFIEHIENPRWEIEKHFYEMEREKLVQLGYQPKGDLHTELNEMFEALIPHEERLEKYRDVINPTVAWD